MSQELGLWERAATPPPPHMNRSVTALCGSDRYSRHFFPSHSHSCADTPVFLAKPSVGFFTDYEIGPVYEVEILLSVAEFLSHTLELGKDQLTAGRYQLPLWCLLWIMFREAYTAHR